MFLLGEGGGKFAMTEERLRTAVQFTYAADTTLQRAQTFTVKLGTTVGNTGLEGLSYDPVTARFILVNERAGSGASQNIFQTGIDFSAGTASNGNATTVDNSGQRRSRPLRTALHGSARRRSPGWSR